MELIKGYDIDSYRFKDLVENWFSCQDCLPKLHLQKSYELFDREHDQSTRWHRIFYEMIRKDDSFNTIYISFLKNIIKPRFGEEIVYQKIPTFRVHLPNNIAVGEFHKDKNYRDEKWAEQVREVNYYLPLTKAYGTNTVWAESEEDLGDFKPIECDYGDCVEWNAYKLTHGNKINKTSVTRVSFDFRVIPKSRYVDSNHLTINTGTPFGIGGYYAVI
tara:strand:- start:1240 stop:1890 length:651 start_codon:yes stop_codon:yes gene_type:complete